MRLRWSTLYCLVACAVSLCWCAAISAQSDEELPRIPVYTLIDRVLQKEIAGELGLDQGGEKAAAIRKLSAEMRQDFLDHYVNPDEQDQKDLKGLPDRVRSKYELKLKELLESATFTRLQQINWQYIGLRSVLDSEIVNALMMTKEQQEKLHAAEDEYAIDTPKALMKWIRMPPGQNAEDRATKSAEDRQNWYRIVKETLSEEQFAKYEELKGAPYTHQSPGYVPSKTRLFKLVPPDGQLVGLALWQPVQKELGIETDTAKVEALRKISSDMWKVKDVNGANYIFGLSPIYLDAKFEHELQKVLSPQQFTRLQQINLQQRGLLWSLEDPKLAKPLGITSEQQARITELNDESVKIHAEIRRTPDLSESQKHEMYLEHVSEQNKLLKDVLTKDQQVKLEMLLGKPFDVAQLRRPPAAATIPAKPQDKK